MPLLLVGMHLLLVAMPLPLLLVAMHLLYTSLLAVSKALQQLVHKSHNSQCSPEERPPATNRFGQRVCFPMPTVYIYIYNI